MHFSYCDKSLDLSDREWETNKLRINYELLVLLENTGILAFAYTRPGGRLNKKDGLTRYGNSHVKDKTS